MSNLRRFVAPVSRKVFPAALGLGVVLVVGVPARAIEHRARTTEHRARTRHHANDFYAVAPEQPAPEQPALETQGGHHGGNCFVTVTAVEAVRGIRHWHNGC